MISVVFKCKSRRIDIKYFSIENNTSIMQYGWADETRMYIGTSICHAISRPSRMLPTYTLGIYLTRKIMC